MVFGDMLLLKIWKNQINMVRVSISIILLVGFITLSFFSCSQKDKGVSPVFRLEGTIIPTDSLQNGYVVINADTTEILIEASKEPFFVEAYNLMGDSANLSYRYGKRGVGPNELIEANSIYYHKPTRNMLLYSSNDMGAQLINLDTYDMQPIHAFRENNALWMMKGEFINDSTLLTACVVPNPKNTKSEWFKLLHLPTGQLTDIEGFSPDDGFDGPLMTKQWIYNSSARIKKHPHRNRFIYGCDEGLYAEIFDLEDNRIVNRKIILDQYPSYHPGSDGISPEGAPDNQMCGFKVSVTPRYIYILTSRDTKGDLRAISRGETPEKFKGPGKGISFSEEVLVFDWEGYLFRKMYLNPFVVNIAVTEDDCTLYGITESEKYDPILVRYNCPEI